MSATVRDILGKDGQAVGAGIFPRGEETAKLELYRVAYAGDGAELTGVQVIDEFETMSGPVMISAVSSLGATYDAALTMAFERSADLDIGSGWPPVVIGLDAAIPVRAAFVTRAAAGDVEAFVIAGALQSVAVIVTARDVSVAALGRVAESAREMLRVEKALVVAVAVADTRKTGGRWTVEFDDAVRTAIGAALEKIRAVVGS